VLLAFCHIVAAIGSASGREASLAPVALLWLWSAGSRDGDYG